MDDDASDGEQDVDDFEMYTYTKVISKKLAIYLKNN